MLFLFSFPNYSYSQQWYQYSDSIISNINKKNYEKASKFLELADSDITKLKPVKDTNMLQVKMQAMSLQSDGIKMCLFLSWKQSLMQKKASTKF